jgi:hypothetical protein
MDKEFIYNLKKLSKIVDSELVTLVSEFGFEEINESDVWLKELFFKLTIKSFCKKVFFKEISIDALNFIEELSEYSGWQFEDYDERKRIVIDDLGLEVYIDLNSDDEKLGGGCSYSIVWL